MADLEKVPDSQMETQAPYEDEAKEALQDVQPTESSMLSESQDFQLVDEETDKMTQEETQATQSENDLPDTAVKLPEDTEKLNPPDSASTKVTEQESEAQADKRVSEQESATPAEKENITSAESEEKTEKAKVTEQESQAQVDKRVSEQESATPAEKENITSAESEEKTEKAEIEENEDDDDDDFVPSSQIDELSPLKKQISSHIGGISQKRKAESFEEPQAKFPRTCSQENALSDVRKQFDDEEDLFAAELTDETLQEAITTNVVIQETQESCTAEGDGESLQEVEQQLEEALSQQDDTDANAKVADNENSEKSSLAEVHSSSEEKKSLISEVLEERIISTMREAIEEKLSSLTEANEDKLSSLNEANEEKESSNGDAIDEKESSNGDAIDEKESSKFDSAEEKKCSNGDSVEEKQSSNDDTVEKPKSSEEDVAKETKSSNGDTAEETKSCDKEPAEKSKLSTEDVAENRKSLITEVAGTEKSSVTEAEKESPTNEVDKLKEAKSTETEESAVSLEISGENSEKIESPLESKATEDLELKDSSPAAVKEKEAVEVRNTAQKSDDSGINSQDISKTQLELPPPIKVPCHKSRMSIEVIYDKATAPPEKKRPRELVEIDEDGEKIVLDSSQEGCDKSMEKCPVDSKIETSYKTCDSKTSTTDYKSVDTSKESSNDFVGYPLTNGSAETKKTDSDQTASPDSDLLAAGSQAMKIDALTTSNKVKNAPEVVISISDSEGDSFVADEKMKNQVEPANRQNATIKIVEKELSILVKLKCLVHIEESTKEQVDKVITSVHSESSVQDLSSTRRRHSDASACLADISGNAGDNRDASPGSVTSNAQPYPLNTRLSLASTISSSSASSTASINAKLATNAQFQLPRIPVKHARKTPSELSTPEAKQDNEAFEQISKEWKHVGLLLTSFFNCAREELVASEFHNGSTERVDNSLERIRSSTPEVEQKDKAAAQALTPKNTNKRGRTAKRPRTSKSNVQSSGSNGLTKTSPVVEAEIEAAAATPSSSRKRKSSPETPSRQSTNSKDSLNDTNDELVGKEVFAKWSDNKYYPGTVIGKTKTKFKVNFYDGQNKLIIEDFIVPMPTTLHVGLSVYATSTDDDYGSCGIIIDAKKVKNNVIYTVQTDEQDEIRVQIKNIFLTNDQVQVLREETKVELKSPPSTPKHLGKVTLDNVVEGTRRSKRITTPVVLTPKAKRARGSLADKSADISKPSSSGISSKIKVGENYDTMSDSNCSTAEVETDMLGVQPELTGTLNEQETKGPASRLKGKARGRKRVEDPEVVAKLGPIPPANSKIFNGMSFLLTCASLEIIDRFQTDTKDSNSDPGTENEEEWTRKPFVRDRLVAQLTAGGGKLYESFELIPPKEYENTKLITNVPNLTKKSLLCLSVGIKAYNHQWIIRCCQENKIVNPSEEELPAGWSLMKQSYVEMFQRRNIKPFQTLPVIVVIPLIPGEKDFVTFWTQICQNAGGAVLLPENPDDDFIEGTVVLTNKRCPSWVIEKAKSWSIPLVSTTWVIQSLIEGNICTYDAHPSFDYNYVKRQQLSHISNLKRLH